MASLGEIIEFVSSSTLRLATPAAINAFSRLADLLRSLNGFYALVYDELPEFCLENL